MNFSIEGLGPAATLFAFIFSSVLTAYVTLRSNDKDDTKEVAAKVEKAANLDVAVQHLANRISEVEKENSIIKDNYEKILEENQKIKNENSNIKKLLVETEEIVLERYPMSLKLLKAMRDENPSTKVVIPYHIISDFNFFDIT